MTGDGEISIRLLAPGEAPSLIALIRACYGETYIDPSFYDEGLVERLYSEGRLHSIGAFTASGRLVGHMGISMRPYDGLTADAGMTLVDPEFRGKGIARDVALGLAQQSMALGDPATPAAVGAIRAEGFFFAGLLPELRDGDVLRMQWLSDSVDDSASGVLSSDATRAIEAYVLQDRAACQG